MTEDIKIWAAGIKAKRAAGHSFRPPAEPAADGEPSEAVHQVEIAAPLDGNQSELYIDGERFKGMLDVAVEFGLDKPTIVTLKFYADVRMRERAREETHPGDEPR